MTTLNRSVWRGNQRSAISRWPVDDTGRNSVIPSIIPSRTTANEIGIRCKNEKTRGFTRMDWARPQKERSLLVPPETSQGGLSRTFSQGRGKFGRQKGH